MKLCNAFFFLMGTSAVSAGNVRRGLEGTPCLELNDIVFTSSCTQSSVQTDIQELLDDTVCDHNRKTENMLLSGESNFGQAKLFLVAACVNNRAKCIENLDVLEYDNCEFSNIQATITDELKAAECSHDKNVEILLHYPECGTVQDARDVMIPKCVATLHPCLDRDNLDFYDTTCQVDEIMTIIENQFAETDCLHSVNQEIELLTGTTTPGAAKQALKAECEDGREPCTAWIDDEIDSCDTMSIIVSIKEQLDAMDATDCAHNLNTELALLTATTNRGEAESVLHQMCINAWASVPTSTFQNVDEEFDAAFMNSYVAGDTFLNTETSNFQGDNPLFPTDDRTREVGENINSFREGGAKTSILESVGTIDSCQNQAMMCCFGRDRQSDDGNGDCSNSNCADEGPGDNSNLCHADGVAYPGQAEGTIHCHGLAWDSDENDPTARFRFNNLFYVSLYDHMYTRGYVENMIDNDAVPMCGCIEDMPPVSRADCTQIEVDHTFILNTDANGYLTVAPKAESLEVQFNQCRGLNPSDGTNANNDLASYVNKLVKQNRMSEATQDTIYEVLVGYDQPGNNANEEACERAVLSLLSLD